MRGSDASEARADAGFPTRSDSSSLFDPLQVLAEIWSLKWLVVLLTLLGIAAGVLLALSTPHKYTAVSEVFIDPRDIKVVQNEVTPNGLPSDATLALIESQIAVIYSNDVLMPVVDKADLVQDTEFNGDAKTLLTPLLSLFGDKDDDDETIRRRELVTLANLRDALNVTRDPKSFVLNIAVTSRNPEKAASLSNLVADSFIDQLAKVQSDTARRASDALSSRLTELRQRVVAAERAVETYKSENRLVGVGGRLVDDDYIVRINDQLAKARGDTTSIRVRAEQMKKASVDDVVKGTFPEELTSDTLNRLRNSYSELAQQTANLASTLGPRHPRRIAAEQALASVREAIQQELQRIVAAAQTELARAEETDRELTAQVNTLKDKQLKTSASFVKLRELEREVDASRAVYEAFLLRARETGEQEGMSTVNVRVISSANPPLNPSSTSRKLVVIAATIAGLIVGLGLAGAIAGIRLIRRFIGQRRAEGLQTQGPSRQASRAGAMVPAATAMPAKEAPDGLDRDERYDDDDLSSAVRPTIHLSPEQIRRVVPERPRRGKGPQGQDQMADRVFLAEAILTETLARPALAVQPDAAGDDGEHGARRATTMAKAEAALPPRSREERDILREKLRTIAEQARFDDESQERPNFAVYNEDIARLQNDILAVKQNLAEARSRRSSLRTPPASSA
ncbi:GumC family protein [Jiella mangrovi]|uniref:GumC family protein n=1 Tax=Jiella mangrovi TaxID=2821407 RepID=A0ABS4BKD5_9HYPH|nr:GumC family protein [Jiella mangrovi]MBP0616519.1 GumC family protein [Jiella mangrovi]